MLVVAFIVTQVLPEMHGEEVNHVTVGVGTVPRPGTD